MLRASYDWREARWVAAGSMTRSAVRPGVLSHRWSTAVTDPAHIFNWRRVDQRLTTSGQPSQCELAEIKALGVTHVVNLGLHSHEKALPDEAASVAALDMTYVYLPVAFDAPQEADFERFRAVFEDLAEARLHIHCIANLRVSAFLYRYWRDVAGRPEADARALMDSVWRPGGVWAAFIGDEAGVGQPHRPPLSAPS